MKISVVILAKNEEHLLDECLSQFHDFADEIVFGDMESHDNSVAIARKYTDKIHHIEQTNYLDSTKSKLCDLAIGDWILVVDADEVFPPALLTRLRQIAENDDADVVSVQRQIYIFRTPVKGLGWQYDNIERFFKKGYLKYSDFHHTPPEITGRLKVLERNDDTDVLHYWVDDWASLVRKLTYYTQGQAEKLDKSGVTYSNFLMIKKVIRQFVSRYFRHYGFVNGWIGFKISVIMSIDVFLTYVRLEEIQKRKKND